MVIPWKLFRYALRKQGQLLVLYSKSQYEGRTVHSCRSRVPLLPPRYRHRLPLSLVREGRRTMMLPYSHKGFLLYGPQWWTGNTFFLLLLQRAVLVSYSLRTVLRK